MKVFLRKSQFCRTLVRAGRELPADIRSLRGTLRRGSIIRQYLDSRTALQIGVGPNELAGWLNSDFSPHRPSTIFMDATQPFPVPSGSFDLIFSEHMIEHVPFEAGQRMLSECWRVLRSGGAIRIATPNLENNFFWGFGHYFVYDSATLSAALAKAGFSNIRSFVAGESDAPELRGLETHAKLIGEEFNLFETMVLQAAKQ